MDTVIKIVAVCLLTAILAVVVRKSNPEIALLMVVAVCCVVLLEILQGLNEIKSFLEQVIAWSGLQQDLFAPLLKTLGIALISRTGADLCRDAGQTAAATLVEMSGTFGAILVALPLFGIVWEMLQTMI